MAEAFRVFLAIALGMGFACLMAFCVLWPFLLLGLMAGAMGAATTVRPGKRRVKDEIVQAQWEYDRTLRRRE